MGNPLIKNSNTVPTPPPLLPQCPSCFPSPHRRDLNAPSSRILRHDDDDHRDALFCTCDELTPTPTEGRSLARPPVFQGTRSLTGGRNATVTLTCPCYHWSGAAFVANDRWRTEPTASSFAKQFRAPEAPWSGTHGATQSTYDDDGEGSSSRRLFRFLGLGL